MPRKQVNAKEVKALRTLHGVEANLPDKMKTRSLTCLKHGVLANSILSVQEREMFYALIDRFEEDYTLNASADFMQVELTTLYFLQLGRAIKAKHWEDTERIDRVLRGHLRDMKATKRGREGESVPPSHQQSPAEWASALLEKVAAGAAVSAGRPVVKRPVRQLPSDEVDENDVIDADNV